MKTLFFVLIFVITAGIALLSEVANAAPSWCENTPKHDLSYRNYVGRSTAPNLDQAFREAVVQARKEAVEENFGFQFHVQTNGNFKAQSDASSESLLTQDFEERSKAVRLEGFERVDTYSSTSDGSGGGVSVCVWFRYPVHAIEKEIERLSKLKGQGIIQNSEMVIQGSEEDSKRGVVKINSTPSGALVSIDGRSWGETPLELRGKLSQGQHHLVLDHPNYERVVRDFEAYEGATTRMDEILKRGIARIQITTVPEGGMVMIQGRHVGESPVGPIEVPAGEWITVVIEHPQAKLYEQRIQLERGELWDRTITLDLKKAHLLFSVSSKDSDVQVDQKTVNGAGLSYELELSAGEHEIHIARAGYSDIDREVVLHGGEVLNLETLSAGKVPEAANNTSPNSTGYHLLDQPETMAVEREPASATEFSSRGESYSPHWIWNFTLLQVTSSPIKNPDMGVGRFGVGLEYSPFWLIGFRLGYYLGLGISQGQNASTDFVSNTLEVGIPIHFLWFHLLGVDSLFVEPEASITEFSYDVTPTGGSQGTWTPSNSIRSTGVDFGYRVFSYPKPNGSVTGVTVRYGMDRNQKISGGFSAQPTKKLGFEINFGF